MLLFPFWTLVLTAYWKSNLNLKPDMKQHELFFYASMMYCSLNIPVRNMQPQMYPPQSQGSTKHCEDSKSTCRLVNARKVRWFF